MSAVLPGGPPARAGEESAASAARGGSRPGGRDAGSDAAAPAQEATGAADAAPVDDVGSASGSTAVHTDRRRGLARWPPAVRVPLQVLGRTLAKAWQDRILGLSAEAAFWQILSVPPLLIGLLGSLGYLGDVIGDRAVREIENQLLEASSRAFTPDVVNSLVRPTLADILGAGRFDVVSLGFLLSLWAGSSATATFMNTIVIAYDQRDVRGPIRTRLMALWLFVVGLVLAVLTLPLLVLGRDVLVSLLPADWRDTATVLVNAVYWPVVLVGLVLAVTTFYHVILPRRLPWHRHLPGTLLAVGFFLVAARLTRAYVADILTATLPYGALATPIAALLFCFFFGMAVLLGAELNATIQARWPAPLRRHQRHSRQRRAAKLEQARRTEQP
ncbi:MAG TPA: YihY/virulence factor BrkB family protein [Geodermatophilus sp.]|nr:YihY/virulence factor BrkB family protein [Geodermatophilus sp.]